MKRVYAAVCLLAWFAPSRALISQDARAALEGRIIDVQGGMIAGASITVVSEETNVSQKTTTNEQGAWMVRFLNPGKYSISVTAPGFKVAERRGVTLQVADSKQIDLTLEVGALSERVTVTAEAPLIDTTAATSGTVVEAAAISEVPVMSRIAYQLAALSPGVFAIEQNQNVAMMWSQGAASSLRVGGGRGGRSNEFLLNGMPNHQGENVSYIPPSDAVAEFRIMSNTYDAQYGRQAGGTINVSVKSGTNHYHGNVYEFHRNSVFDANQFQSNLAGQPKSLSHYNLYGTTFGGPVFLPKVYQGKDKTFFFYTFEGLRLNYPEFTNRSVPTELERAGDFTGSFTTRVIGGQTERVPITIFDPLTVDARPTILVDGKETRNPNYGYRQPFPGNRVSADRVNPIALKILGFVPLPNTASLPTGNATSNFVPDTTRRGLMNSTMFRLDHAWNNSHKSFAAAYWNRVDTYAGYDFDNASTGIYQTNWKRGFGLDHVWNLSPNKILNLRYNLTRFEKLAWDGGKGFNPTELGFSPSFVNKMEAYSFPYISGLFGNIGGSAGSLGHTSYQFWNANLTHVRGNMTFHYGAEFRVMQEPTKNPGYQSGSFALDSGWTRRRYDASETGYGATMASFLLGLPASGSFPRNANRFDSQRFWGFFFQNDWRVKPRLTLNAGLRWDHQRPFVERFDRMTSSFDPTVLNPISDAAQQAYASVLGTVLKDPVRYPFAAQLAQLVPVTSFKVYGAQLFNGVNGQPRTATGSNWSQWQPRFGFAYLLTNKTVLRGGFGRFTQSTGTKGGQNGFSRTTTLAPSRDSGLTPYDTLANPFRDGILEPTGSSLGPLTNLGQSVSWIDQRGEQPHSWIYSLYLQREYRNWLFEAGYTHNKTYDIETSRQQNDIGFADWQTLRMPRFDSTGKPLAKPYLGDEQVPNPFYGLPGVTGTRASSQLIAIYDLMRPIKVLGGQSLSNVPWGRTTYDDLQVKIQRRFSSGFSLIFAYTFSKLMEDTSFWGPEISGPLAEHVIGSEDRPHKVSIAPIFQIPIGRGRALGRNLPKVLDAIVGGWEITGQHIVQSGSPISFGTDSFFDGQNFALSRGDRTLYRWFDTSHFVKFPGIQDDISKFPAWTGVQNLPGASYKPSTASDPKNGVYSDFGTFVRRYPTRWSNVRSSRVNELNGGVYKNFRIGEKVRVTARGEFYNAFNHPRFPGPNTNPGSADFGRVGQYQNNLARTVQVALKIGF